MSGIEPSRAPRVFLSYSSRDAQWIKVFKHALTDGEQLGIAVIEDFLDGSNIAFGQLGSWIDAQVDQASVVIAFISASYLESKYSVLELRKSLKEHQLNRLLFVPVMLDGDAKQSWRNAKAGGNLRELAVDYQFADFTAGGKRIELDLNYVTGPATKITNLAHTIRDFLSSPAPALVPHMPPPGHPLSPILPTRIVLLGHPTNEMPKEIRDSAGEVVTLLTAGGLTVETWKDGWEDDPPKIIEPAQMFVRPLSGLEAASHAKDTAQTKDQLRAAGVEAAPVTLWLPPPLSDMRFKQAAIKSRPEDRPALRTDTPADLAKWLRSLLSVGHHEEALVLQIEDLDAGGDVLDPQSRRLADNLQSIITNVVGLEVLPSPTPWKFTVGLFHEQVAILPARSIVVLHDLDIAPTRDHPAARDAFLQKFNTVYQDLDGRLPGDGTHCRDVFKVAVAMNTAGAMPFTEFPKSGRWHEWKVLRLQPLGESPAPGVPPPLMPHPGSLENLRTHLRAWAQR